MSLKERLIKNAATRLKGELARRTGRDGAIVATAVRAFVADARAANINPFELIPEYLERFELVYGDEYRRLETGRGGSKTSKTVGRPAHRGEILTACRRRAVRRMLANNDEHRGACSYSINVHGYTFTRNWRDQYLLDQLIRLGATSFGPRTAATLLGLDWDSARSSLQRLVKAKVLKQIDDQHFRLMPSLRLLAYERLLFVRSAAYLERVSIRYVQ